MSMSLSYKDVNETSLKRSARAATIEDNNAQETSVSSSLPNTFTFPNLTPASKKRPRTSLHENSATINENSDDDSNSIDSVLDAIHTILGDEDETDTVVDFHSRLTAPDATNDDPDDYLLLLLREMFPHIKLQVKSFGELNNYFSTPTEEQMSKYTTEVVNVVRMNNADAMNEYYKTHGRTALDCCNRFGEGLLNMACRRGFTATVQYLLSPEIQLNVRVRDDGGRTPLHDACWYPEPQLEVCTMILQQDPSLFLVADKRGYTPFQYARQSDWHIWRQLLYSNYQALHALAKPEVVETFSCSKE